MTKEQEELFEGELKKQIENATLRGMGIGAKSISAAIYEKVKVDTTKMSKNDVVRILKDIKKFCETGLAIKEDEIK